MTAAGVSAGLSGLGAGTTFTGTYFSHDFVAGPLPSLIDGDFGSVLRGGTQGAGYFMVGGQTNAYFHSGGDPFQLRVNELNQS